MTNLNLELIEDPKTAEQLLYNINKRLERITRYLSAICVLLGVILGLLIGGV